VRDASPTHPSSLPAADARPSPLLSTLDVMALVVGIVIGAGIFSAPALIAGNAAGMEHILIAWLVGGLISLAGAMCYAELATSYPDAGAGGD
jgi:basic amino acid/polyamine antiporter, APA family